MTPVVVATCSAGLFLALARAAVAAPVESFRRMSAVMAVVAAGVAVASPLVGFPLLGSVLLGSVLLGSVLLGTSLAPEPVPATVPGRLDRYRPPSA